MSAKTKIVVLHMKRIITAAILAAVVLILAVILLIMLKPKDESAEESVPTMYVPGVYTSSVQLDGKAVDVQVVVDENNINAISCVHMDETTETMYPLLAPAMEELAEQITASQSLENITYSQSHPYTSMVLLSAIEDALKKAAAE